MPRNSPDSDSAAAPPKVKVTRETLGQMFSLYAYLQPYRGRLFLGVFLLLCSSALGISFPMLAGRLINSPTHAVANQFVWVIFGVLFVQAVMTYFQSMCFNTVGEYGLADLRKALFAHLLLTKERHRHFRQV